MKHLFQVCVFAFIMAITACSSNEKKTDPMQTRIDSLMKVNQEQRHDLENLSSFVNVISSSLDSIMFYEDSLLFNKGNESPKITKEQIKQNLDELKDLVERQKQQITQLRKQLETAEGANAEKMRKLVAFYEAQINKKNSEIANLRAELDKRNIDISQLRTHVSNLTTNNQQLEEKNKELDGVITVQDEILNKAFVKIGTKAELSAAGLLEGGGLFKKKKVNYSNLDQSLFQEVDIRAVAEIAIPSKKAKLLTPVPSDSYSLEKSGNSMILFIKNPTRFWSASNYLIIQTN